MIGTILCIIEVGSRRNLDVIGISKIRGANQG